MGAVTATGAVWRPLPTAFDDADDPVTVATPSCCCCCCCCCLVTIAGASAFAAADAHAEAEARGRPATLPLTLALLAVPVGVFVLLSLGVDDWVRLVAGLVATAVLFGAAYAVAGARGTLSAGRAGVLTAFAAVGMIVEVYAALATAFVVELLAPVAVWLGIAAARRLRGSRPNGPPAPPTPPPPGVPW